MFGFLKNDKKIISANISMSVNCMECVSDIKINLYKGRNLGAYVKTKDWVKAFSKTDSRKDLSYNLVLKTQYLEVIRIFILIINWIYFLCPHPFRFQNYQ